MAAATPLALFGLGVLVSQQAKHQTDAQNQTERQRKDREATLKLRLDEQIRNEAAVRLTQTENAAARLQRELRDVADRREQQLRREGFDREEALRNEAATREADVRRQTLALAQSSKLIDRRIEFWDKLAPRFVQIDRIVDRILVGESDADQLEAAFREVDDLFGLYRPYFSLRFESAYEDYETTIRFFLDHAREPGGLQEMVVTDGVESICQRYFALRDGAATEIAAGTGIAQNAAAPTTTGRMWAECARRRENARVRFKQRT